MRIQVELFDELLLEELELEFDELLLEEFDELLERVRQARRGAACATSKPASPSPTAMVAAGACTLMMSAGIAGAA